MQAAALVRHAARNENFVLVAGKPHHGLGAPRARPPERSGAWGPRERRRRGVRGAKPLGSGQTPRSHRMLPRFLAPDLSPDADEVALSAEEAHHLARVLRLKVGDAIVVFDGRGHEATAIV